MHLGAYSRGDRQRRSYQYKTPEFNCKQYPLRCCIGQKRILHTVQESSSYFTNSRVRTVISGIVASARPRQHVWLVLASTTRSFHIRAALVRRTLRKASLHQVTDHFSPCTETYVIAMASNFGAALQYPRSTLPSKWCVDSKRRCIRQADTPIDDDGKPTQKIFRVRDLPNS